MASNRTSPKRNTLPQRFVPYLEQAQTQGALRYGAQETGLQGLFDSATQNYQRQSAAQEGASRSLLGSLATGSVNLNNAYSDAGLTPEVRAQYAGTPDGQRILASLARGQGDIQQQQIGAQAGRQYIQQRLGDDYRTDVGKIEQQRAAMSTERGLYESSLLDQLIGDDRAGRQKINADARQQQFTADQAIQQQQSTRDNALIGQGLLPDAQGNLTPLPGGKADPNAKTNKPKKVKATRAEQSRAATDFSTALGIATDYVGNDPKDKALRREIGQKLLRGEETIKGKPVYDTRQQINGKPNPSYGKPLLNKDGTVQTTGDLPGIQKVDNQPIVQAALDMVFDGHLSPATVRKLHDLGYEVRGLSGVKTRADVPKPKPQQQPKNRAVRDPRTGQSRPT